MICVKRMNILAVGNSFSADSTYYLHSIAATGGIDTKVVNLFIGGCSLKRHWENILSGERLYQYQRDGETSDRYVSIQEALQEEEWDAVISHQSSPESGMKESYDPYLMQLYDYIKEQAPKAKRFLQETWAYEIDSDHEAYRYYHHNQQEMYEKIQEAYTDAAKRLKVTMIPSGDIIQAVRKKEPFRYERGERSLCRDGYHMNYLYGRYLLAATWYEVILGKSILENSYVPQTRLAPDETADLYTLEVIKKTVHEILAHRHEEN